ncbi:MAG: hypothetical protein K0U98_14505 [Deltaproteobacteria bacterium]|nr:hypothetical protein [Deltaproteobacteria bacterium]
MPSMLPAKPNEVGEKPGHPVTVTLLVALLVLAGSVVFTALEARFGLPDTHPSGSSPQELECQVRISPYMPRIIGEHFSTRFRIELLTSPPAVVYGEYKITYRDSEGRQRTEPGVLRKAVTSSGRELYREDVALSSPVEVLSVIMLKAHCSPLEEEEPGSSPLGTAKVGPRK